MSSHAKTAGARIRPYVDKLPGLDGEFLNYLIDRCDSQGGTDSDEAWTLENYDRQARLLANGGVKAYAKLLENQRAAR